MLKYSKIKRYNGWLSIVQVTDTKTEMKAPTQELKNTVLHIY